MWRKCVLNVQQGVEGNACGEGGGTLVMTLTMGLTMDLAMQVAKRADNWR